MFGALLYLRLTSLRNLVLFRLRRLRQPRYLIGTLFGLGYFYFLVFRQAHVGVHALGSAGLGTVVPATSLPLVVGGGGLILLVIVLGMWALPGDQPGFKFTEAEIAFLFPAPLTRRALIHYKLLSTLFTSLLQTFFFALIFNGRALLTGRLPYLLAGWWVLLSLISLHHLGSSLTIARLVDRGINAVRRRILIFGTVAAAAGAIAVLSWRTMPNLLLTPSVAEWVQALFERSALRWVLWPFEAVVRPFVATDARSFLVSFAPLVLALVAHYFWVARSNVAFEEASIAKAERRAARVAAMRRTGMQGRVARTVGRRPPFNLGRRGRPEAAFLWKNLLSTNPWITPRTWYYSAGILIMLSAGLQRIMGPDYWMAGGALAAVGTLCAGGALFYGPLILRLDLRHDLANADMLKAYPLPGWSIVMGELLAPIAILSGVVWLGILCWYLGLQGHQPPALPIEWFNPQMRLVVACCAAAATPFIVGLELLIPNAAPVLLPGWFQTLRTPGAGIDLMGQRLIFGFGQVLVTLVAVGFAATIALAVEFMIRGLFVLAAWGHFGEATGPSPFALLVTFTAMLVGLIAGEVWCGVWWVGRRFEKLDVSETGP